MSENSVTTYESIVKRLGKYNWIANVSFDYRSIDYINTSFSSSGEDLWLRQFMKSRLRSGQPGFYVDVGANHPFGTSNTHLFYCYGWRGICIDANLRFKDDFGVFRPRDVFINAAISDLGTSLYFAEERVVNGHKIARVMRNASDFDARFFPPIQVPAMTLADVLRQNVPQGTVIDFMTIDVEDSELPALRSNDWSVYMPRVILIEIDAKIFNPLVPLDFPTIAFLHALGYSYQGYANNNVLMKSPSFDALG